ncbi:DMT family transporter [Corynebacterium doosanense]|uniref:Cation transporter n=1 Tax=Corynebacterium doosanense CAU 212 = DSM 45436 TaxID=558173 RepID=A0A097ICY8_9CORY|nr:SMR family transporter [Corynebacterium doosanense]AIT59993.1 cation transporter [Corynebacterium doosanense CAU 212 = DSM 45436]
MNHPATWLGAAIIAEIVATLSLKAALNIPWLYAVVLIGYVAAFTCLDRVLRLGMPIGVAYGIWGAVGVAATALLAPVLFGEPLSGLMLAGIAIIVAGVLCIELGGREKKR